MILCSPQVYWVAGQLFSANVSRLMILNYLSSTAPSIVAVVGDFGEDFMRLKAEFRNRPSQV
jgi:hypothetical protein